MNVKLESYRYIWKIQHHNKWDGITGMGVNNQYGKTATVGNQRDENCESCTRSRERTTWNCRCGCRTRNRSITHRQRWQSRDRGYRNTRDRSESNHRRRSKHHHYSYSRNRAQRYISREQNKCRRSRTPIYMTRCQTKRDTRKQLTSRNAKRSWISRRA